MKKLILVMVMIFAVQQIEANPWQQKTKHKTIKRMTRAQVRKAQIGYTLYERNPKTDKIEKNMNRPWSTVKKPTTYNAFHNNKKTNRNPIFNGKK